MTRQRLESLKGQKMTVELALELAFGAGSARAIASHAEFTQIHEPSEVVVPALLEMLEKDGTGLGSVLRTGSSEVRKQANKRKGGGKWANNG
jgi:hypothetical protein